ncbi:hypothetical protein MKS88_002373 [Plasmodium brasilianum]|uniref:Uncharacterized protein n=1 Tax=Plasmodium brasilianum TaxID=5824 RepID=A0ACB9YAS2_PLABR|nr:hypothetical protein MKS88_002373 [Plasmodium brasilianum]
MKVPLKKQRAKGYYSCLDFDNLYKKKKKNKIKYSIYREKNYSDSELFDKKKLQIKKKNGYILYVQKHCMVNNNGHDNKLYVLNNVTIYKNHFDKYEETNDEKLTYLKKIFKIYENATTNEKRKLYELIKFFSFTPGGFQNNKLRQKLWLLLLGFNINLSKEKNYNEHPISILCKKYKKKFKYINYVKHFKLKWKKKKSKNSFLSTCISREHNNTGKRNRVSKKQKQNKIYHYDNCSCQEKKEFLSSYGLNCGKINTCVGYKEGDAASLLGKCNERKLQENEIPNSSNITNIRYATNRTDHCEYFLRTSDKQSCSIYAVGGKELRAPRCSSSGSNSRNAKNPIFLKKREMEYYDSAFSYSSSTKSFSSVSCTRPLPSIPLGSLDHSSLENSLYLSDGVSSSSSTHGSSSLSSLASNYSNDINTAVDKSSKMQRKKCPLQFFSSGKFFKCARDIYCIKKEKVENKTKSKNSHVLNFFFSDKKYKMKRKMNRVPNSEIIRKAKKSIKKESNKIVNFLLKIDKEKETFDKNKNKKFIIKLLKIIYNNMLEVDLYIVDYIIRKDNLSSKNDILSYLKDNIKHNYNFNSNLNKWIIDSVLLEENERVQVKKDVKRSVNTWNIHKYNIYEIKKKYQYILKNVICSILYKHSNKIFYAQGVHDVCLVFVTVYFHNFFLRYKKYVFLEYFISKFVVNKICNLIFTKRYRSGIATGSNCAVFTPSKDVKYIRNTNYYTENYYDHVHISHGIDEMKEYTEHMDRRVSHGGDPSDDQSVGRVYAAGNEKKCSNDVICSSGSSNSSSGSSNNSSGSSNNSSGSSNNSSGSSNNSSGSSNSSSNGGGIDLRRREGKSKRGDDHDIFINNVKNMFLMEEKYIEKICLLNNIDLEKYIKYKKKKKKKEYIVYLLCERFLLFYMIDYLTLSLDVSIKNTFKCIGLLLKYLDKEVYDVFCLLQMEQEHENLKHTSSSANAGANCSTSGRNNNRGNNSTGNDGNNRISNCNNCISRNERMNSTGKSSKVGNYEIARDSLKLSGTEFFFCLSWVVTYYSHVLTEFDRLARIFDTLLSNDGIFIIYFTGSIILYKREELLELANKKKKDLLYNNMYTETHYIFQNMNWKDINVENIIKKTYYYMNYKIPFETFLKKIKKKISFPPFSPIYSYPFILHYFNYETKQDDLKNKIVEKSFMNFYTYKSITTSMNNNSCEESGLHMSSVHHEEQQIISLDGDKKDSNKRSNESDSKGESKSGSKNGSNDNIKSSHNSNSNTRNNSSGAHCKNGNERNTMTKKYLNNDVIILSSSNSDRVSGKVMSDRGVKKYYTNSRRKKHRYKRGTRRCENCRHTYCNVKNSLNKMDIYDEYIEGLLNRSNVNDCIKHKNKNNSTFKNKENNKDNNIYLYYPYSILCNNLDVDKDIIKKHLLVENFFQYVFYDFIVNYKSICRKHRNLTTKYYIIQYMNVKNKKEYIMEKRKKQKKQKKKENIFHKMLKHILLFHVQKCELKKNKKFICMNFITKNKKNSSNFNNFVNNKNNKKTIAIIPPIYKYTIQNSEVKKNFKVQKIKNTNSFITDIQSTKENNKSVKNIERIFYILKMSVYNSPYVNIFLVFFLLSVFSSLLYFHR